MFDHRFQWYGGRTYAQHGDDLAILNLFGGLRVEKPTYLDIGAHHPFNLSNTALLHQRGSRGINVEAHPRLIKEFMTFRPEDTNVNVAVVADRNVKEVTLYCLDQSEGINTTVKGSLGDYGGSRFEVTVPATTADELIDQYAGGAWPHLLSLDAEGRDLEIIQSINWKRETMPLVICVEAVSQMGDISTELKAKLTSVGYFMHSWCGGNMLFVQKQFKDQIT